MAVSRGHVHTGLPEVGAVTVGENDGVVMRFRWYQELSHRFVELYNDLRL
jgi:hypothetical protein